jgi:hypothetical protein
VLLGEFVANDTAISSLPIGEAETFFSIRSERQLMEQLD